MWEIIDNSSNGFDLDCIIGIRYQADIEADKFAAAFEHDFWFPEDM